MRRKTAVMTTLVALLVVGSGMLAATEVISHSRAPPFPVVWSRSLSGSSASQLVVGDSIYFLDQVNSGGFWCVYEIDAMNVANGMQTWLSKPFNLTSAVPTSCQGVGLPSMLPIGRTLYVVAPILGLSATFPNGTSITRSFGNLKLGSLGFDLQTGHLDSVSSVVAPSSFTKPGGEDYLGSGFSLSNGVDIFAGTVPPGGGGPTNSLEMQVEAIQPGNSRPVWVDNISIPINSTQDVSSSRSVNSTSLDVLLSYADEQCLQTEATQNCPLSYRLVSFNTVDGSATQEEISPWTVQAGVSVKGPDGYVVFRFTGMVGNQSIIGQRASDGKIVMNTSAISPGGLQSVDGELLYDYPIMCAGMNCGGPPNGYIAYTPAGQVVWSLQMDTGASMGHWSPFLFAGHLVLLSNVRTGFVATSWNHLDYGGLYGSFYLVNSTNGDVVWKTDYNPIVFPPFTADGPAPLFYPMTSAGNYMFFSNGVNPTTIYCVDVNQLR